MLVFISDLHFIDGTAGEHNVSLDAFRLFFEDIAGKAHWLEYHRRKIKDITIIFLGDIFDLLRTQKWFSYPENERPWGRDDERIEQHANSIFDDLARINGDIFNLLRGNLKKEFGLPVNPKIIYVPGNHDRLCCRYRSLQEKVCSCLGISDHQDNFRHYFEDVEYGVFARHGHEYDIFNFEGGYPFTEEAYMRVPIGDVITAELVVKIPWQIMQNDEMKNLPERERKMIRSNLEAIDNVRPLSAVIEWLIYNVKNSPHLRGVIEDTIDEVIREFNKLVFVKKWYEGREKKREFFSAEDRIKAVLFLFEKFKVFSFKKFMPLLDRVKKSRLVKDRLLEGALAEYAHLDERIRYIVYGHTHIPLQVALRTAIGHNDQKEEVYLNTGTWRPRYQKNREGIGFIGWKNLSYVIFYRKDERAMPFPTFETWNGTLKTI
jgi:UDP-2,3-diacylglucosamine pyrophosphatase LpxH